MSKQRVAYEIDVPNGYELTGEYRVPDIGEHHLYNDRGEFKVSVCATPNCHGYMIVRKIEPDIRTGWINVYGIKGQDHIAMHGNVWATKDAADLNRSVHRSVNRFIACVEIKYEVPRQ